MTIVEALRRGIREVDGRKRLWLVFYAAATVPGLLLAAMLASTAFLSLGHSLWADQMGRDFDLQWFGELAVRGTLPAGSLAVALAGAFAMSALVSLFLSGGAVDLFLRAEEFTAAGFFGGCGQHFWRLFRLAAVSVFFYGLALAANSALANLGRKIWGEGSEATPLVYWSWLRVALLLCLLGYVNLVFDYARIRLVAGDNRSAFRAAFAAFGLVRRNFAPMAGLYTALWGMAALWLAAYFAISRTTAQLSISAVLVLLVVRQAVVLAKIWWRLLFFSSEVALYDSLRPVPVGDPDPGEPRRFIEPAQLAERARLAEPVPPAGPAPLTVLAQSKESERAAEPEPSTEPPPPERAPAETEARPAPDA